MMGGKLLAESAPGVGSKFSFELSFDTIDVLAELPRDKIHFGGMDVPRFEGEVLLCEDNAMNQLVICEHLSRVGLRTIVAENGRIGTDLVIERKKKGEKPFDLVFMDIHMPVMDGIEASHEIYSLTPETPIIAITANIMSNEMELYKISKMTDCLGKPFTAQEFWRCLLKYLSPIEAEGYGAPKLDEAKLRKKLLIGFARDNQNKYAEITDALDAGDIKLAHRLAHTLKGVAAMVGKNALKDAAREVEQSLKNGENNATVESLANLDAELAAVLQELAPFLEQEDRNAAKLDENAAKELLLKLREMLQNRNPECINSAADVRKLPIPGGDADKLADLVENLEFKQAIELLNGMEVERFGGTEEQHTDS
jgi:CheY-like chemotaxis protein